MGSSLNRYEQRTHGQIIAIALLYVRMIQITVNSPYNTGMAFLQYNDSMEHSIWLSLMYARLRVFYNLLSSDGSFWVSLDDNEAHYYKVLCDEVFEREIFWLM